MKVLGTRGDPLLSLKASPEPLLQQHLGEKPVKQRVGGVSLPSARF